MGLSTQNIEMVKQGMFDVMNAPGGTAGGARFDFRGLKMAGKTGSAGENDAGKTGSTVDHNAGETVLTEENADGMILYVNHAFARMTGRAESVLTGGLASELFPMQGRAWSRIAYRAAVLGEEITDFHLDYQVMGVRMSVTASQVIGPGYCAFTYQTISRDS